MPKNISHVICQCPKYSQKRDFVASRAAVQQCRRHSPHSSPGLPLSLKFANVAHFLFGSLLSLLSAHGSKPTSIAISNRPFLPFLSFLFPSFFLPFSLPLCHFFIIFFYDCDSFLLKQPTSALFLFSYLFFS